MEPRSIKPIERSAPEVVQHTEEEVEQEIARISVSDDVRGLSGFLETRDANWAERDAALRRLGELVNAGMLDANSPDFGSLLKALLTGLVAQLPDLRSQVARSACETLAIVAGGVGDHAAMERPMRELVMPGLISLASSGNKVLASAGRECMPAVVMCCHFEGMLKVLATTVGESRHAAVRHTCCVCVLHALQHWPLPVLTAVSALLERALVPAATDAAVEVRALARQCLVQYSAAFPERAAAVEGRLDSPTRRLLRQEEGDAPAPRERHVLSQAARRPAPGH